LKKKSQRGVRHSTKVTMLLPDTVAQALKVQAAEEGCSMSWIVTALVMDYVGITQKELERLEGPRPPKQFKDRVGEWTPRKKVAESKDELSVAYTCVECEMDFTGSEKEIAVRQGHCCECWGELTIEEKKDRIRKE
jgi:hypothetical protein